MEFIGVNLIPGNCPSAVDVLFVACRLDIFFFAGNSLIKEKIKPNKFRNNKIMEFIAGKELLSHIISLHVSPALLCSNINNGAFAPDSNLTEYPQ